MHRFFVLTAFFIGIGMTSTAQETQLAAKENLRGQDAETVARLRDFCAAKHHKQHQKFLACHPRDNAHHDAGFRQPDAPTRSLPHLRSTHQPNFGY